jgi:hypothetical protein
MKLSKVRRGRAGAGKLPSVAVIGRGGDFGSRISRGSRAAGVEGRERPGVWEGRGVPRHAGADADAPRAEASGASVRYTGEHAVGVVRLDPALEEAGRHREVRAPIGDVVEFEPRTSWRTRPRRARRVDAASPGPGSGPGLPRHMSSRAWLRRDWSRCDTPVSPQDTVAPATIQLRFVRQHNSPAGAPSCRRAYAIHKYSYSLRREPIREYPRNSLCLDTRYAGSRSSALCLAGNRSTRPYPTQRLNTTRAVRSLQRDAAE